MYHARPHQNQMASGFRARTTPATLPGALKQRNAAVSAFYFHTDRMLTKALNPLEATDWYEMTGK